MCRGDDPRRRTGRGGTEDAGREDGEEGRGPQGYDGRPAADPIAISRCGERRADRAKHLRHRTAEPLPTARNRRLYDLPNRCARCRGAGSFRHRGQSGGSVRRRAGIARTGGGTRGHRHGPPRPADRTHGLLADALALGRVRVELFRRAAEDVPEYRRHLSV